jgi:hypothetical protein
VVQLKVDPAYAPRAELAGFAIVSLDLPPTQRLQLFDTSINQCDGPPLSFGSRGRLLLCITLIALSS